MQNVLSMGEEKDRDCIAMYGKEMKPYKEDVKKRSNQYLSKTDVSTATGVYPGAFPTTDSSSTPVELDKTCLSCQEEPKVTLFIF